MRVPVTTVSALSLVLCRRASAAGFIQRPFASHHTIRLMTSLHASGSNVISPKDCSTKLADGWKPWVLDVRAQSEHDIVALSMTDKVSPHDSVSLSDIPESGDVLVYCKAGLRGQKAVDRLIELGADASRLYNLEGGIMGWQSEVDDSLPRY